MPPTPSGPAGIVRRVVLLEPAADVPGETCVDLAPLGEQQVDVEAGEPPHHPTPGPWSAESGGGVGSVDRVRSASFQSVPRIAGRSSRSVRSWRSDSEKARAIC